MYTATGAIERSYVDYSQSVQQFAPLVHRIAHHMQSRLPASVEVDDLIQAGMLGLMDALGRFEDGQGAQFETYASQRIRGAMLDELRQNDWLPRGVRKTQRQIESVLNRVEQRLGRSAGESEIASEMGVNLQQYQEMLADARGGQLMYYSDYDGDGEDADPFLDRHYADHAADPQGQVGDARFKAALVTAIENLPEREKLLMGLYYEQELNFREIAAVLGVTESRVCQLHTQTVARLRTRLKDWQP
jgi:RNA polymerase sigma factor FliA